MNSYNLIDPVPYQVLNVTGALGVAVLCYHQAAWSTVFLEVTWAGIGFSALMMVLYQQYYHKEEKELEQKETSE